MLGRLKMSIHKCIESYLQLSDRIFQKKWHRVTIKGHILGRFKSEELGASSERGYHWAGIARGCTAELPKSPAAITIF
jgi:hypothetical protein